MGDSQKLSSTQVIGWIDCVAPRGVQDVILADYIEPVVFLANLIRGHIPMFAVLSNLR